MSLALVDLRIEVALRYAEKLLFLSFTPSGVMALLYIFVAADRTGLSTYCSDTHHAAKPGRKLLRRLRSYL
jgi:hypothetical protein